jgi:hypothetical protein
MSSTNIRLALSRRVLAIVRTCVATLAGRLTLCRTALFSARITPLCTKSVRLSRSSRGYLPTRVETAGADFAPAGVMSGSAGSGLGQLQQLSQLGVDILPDVGIVLEELLGVSRERSPSRRH